MTEKRTEKRTVGISDRDYGILEYGAKVYGISKGEYLHKLIDWFIEREPNLIERFEQNSTVVSDLKPNSTVSIETHSQLIEEGLKIIEDVSPKKAEELREKLKRLNSTVTEESEPNSTVVENPNEDPTKEKTRESSESQENMDLTVSSGLEQKSTVVNAVPRKAWYGTFSLEEHGIPSCLLEH